LSKPAKVLFCLQKLEGKIERKKNSDRFGGPMLLCPIGVRGRMKICGCPQLDIRPMYQYKIPPPLAPPPQFEGKVDLSVLSQFTLKLS
jgi:hypothetical protein